ncbi:hypothetical protein [Burkholderia pyrrocinia]
MDQPVGRKGRPRLLIGAVDLTRAGIKSHNALAGPKAGSTRFSGILVNLDRQHAQAMIAQPRETMAPVRENCLSIFQRESWNKNLALADRFIFAVLVGSAIRLRQHSLWYRATPHQASRQPPILRISANVISDFG